MTAHDVFEFRRRQVLAGEQRILRAKLRFAIDRARKLTGELVLTAEAASVIETLLQAASDQVSDQPSGANAELVRAVARVLAADQSHERAAA